MKLLVFSDLHLEHDPAWLLPDEFPDYDVCIAAGDIHGSPGKSILTLAAHPVLRERPIIFVAGNHEFYGGVYEDRIAEGKAAAAETGVHYLSGESVGIGGVRFVGATLWTDYHLHGNRPLAMIAAQGGLNDHRYIKRRAYKAGDLGRFRWLPKDAAWHHNRHRAAIEAALAEPFGGQTVVVTHHGPSPQSLAGEHHLDPLNPAYASDLEGLMHGASAPALWIHGHIHRSMDYTVGSTSVRSNPKGYGPGLASKPPQNREFDPGLVIEVPEPAPASVCRL